MYSFGNEPSETSGRALRPTKLSIQLVYLFFHALLNWSWPEADRSLVGSAENKNAWIFTATPPICFLLHAVK